MTRSDPSLPRVAIYARTATDIRTPNSVEKQLASCRLHAQQQGWPVAMEHFDKDLSGPDADRPGFRALSEAIETGAVDIVLFVALDGLVRDPEILRAFQRAASRAGVELHQIEYGKAQLLDLARLSASDFTRLATIRAARRPLHGSCRASSHSR